MDNLQESVHSTAEKYEKDPKRMLDIIRDVQDKLGCISKEAIDAIAGELDVAPVDVEGVATFYHFFSAKPVGKYAVYLNDGVVAKMKGRDVIAKAFEKEAGAKFGSISSDGLIGLFDTSCIGMSDQEPAAIINGVVFTSLTEAKVKELVAGMKNGKDVGSLVTKYGDGQNSSELVKSMVVNNIRRKGDVLFAPFTKGSAVKKAASMQPADIVEEIKKSNIRGRGGAGFPVGMKWDFTAKSQANKKYIICNADEGEPGTFKDRVILTELPHLLFEGMAVAGYAIGADEGLVYLRAEYAYLKNYLENVLEQLRKENIIGKDIAGKKGFNFDLRIVLGAGAYVCGEESALMESAEGRRGQPRNRPPFPAQKGYLGKPTAVNNVESLCTCAVILVNGAEWFKTMGTVQSKGTKLLSISGDCENPGVYEVEFGITIQNILETVGGRDAIAVQVGGPTGTCVSKKDFGRRICYDDLSTGGSVIVIGPNRDLLEIVNSFMDFFVLESCGWCTPCRAGNVIIKNKLEKIISGHASKKDLSELEEWCNIVKTMSRCGFGTASPNIVLTTIKNFPEVYEAKLKEEVNYNTAFDLLSAVKLSCETVGRIPKLEAHNG